MKIIPVEAMLSRAGLAPPTLNALKADVTNYRLCLLQPKGDIEWDPSGIRHCDAEAAKHQFAAFIDEVLSRSADLAVTPEYAMPWSTLVDALKAGKAPPPGKLWAFGCASISYQDLVNMRTDMAGRVHLLFEDLTPTQEQNFVDPLAYVFRAPKKRNKKLTFEIVVLVQFKTKPMSDPQNYEVKHLARGTQVYQFGDSKSVKLVSFICSDVLNFHTDIANEVYHRGLILHIQLNPAPRHQQYRLYREQILGLSGDETELICLNWAGGVAETHAGQQKIWPNVSGSAWYLKPREFDGSDERLANNHRRGLYYTYAHGLRLHVQFFNFEPGMFVLDTTKVAHHGQLAVTSRRLGPALTSMHAWGKGGWTEVTAANDGFSTIAPQAGGAQACVEALSAYNPIYAERVLALSAGQVRGEAEWYAVSKLDSCTIAQDEIIHRITFCQDPDPQASQFRVARIRSVRHLKEILSDQANLPPSLDDLKTGVRFKWTREQPHQNVYSLADAPATAVYVGESASEDDARKTRDWLDELLRREGDGGENTLKARQRLFVWHRDESGLQRLDPSMSVRIDTAKTTSPLDIAKDN